VTFKAPAQRVRLFAIATVNQWCLLVTYEKLGRHANAEAARANMKASQGDAAAYRYATIYAQWSDTHRSPTQGAAIPGDRAGAEVSGLTSPAQT